MVIGMTWQRNGMAMEVGSCRCLCRSAKDERVLLAKGQKAQRTTELTSEAGMQY